MYLINYIFTEMRFVLFLAAVVYVALAAPSRHHPLSQEFIDSINATPNITWRVSDRVSIEKILSKNYRKIF